MDLNILTDEELLITRLVLQGVSNKEIATKLKLPIEIILSKLKNIFSKTNVHNRVQLTVWFLNSYYNKS